ncbi:hypothetical protein [Pontibacter burrus]|uniref:Uncharacterized protein n=1 Tax=Pontibacter burrus TaxID=2704466 RepID=A0A6B3LVP3_9BACT|nr:hypothetical protein [Pontibacter burrus]NEM98356.1 hypothetical protein [Pontibacter burrus]
MKKLILSFALACVTTFSFAFSSDAVVVTAEEELICVPVTYSCGELGVVCAYSAADLLEYTLLTEEIACP